MAGLVYPLACQDRCYDVHLGCFPGFRSGCPANDSHHPIIVAWTISSWLQPESIILKFLSVCSFFWEFGSFDTLHPRRLLRLLRLEPLRTLSGCHCDTSQTNSVPMTFFLRCLFLILCLAHEVASRWKVEGDLESHLAK